MRGASIAAYFLPAQELQRFSQALRHTGPLLPIAACGTSAAMTKKGPAREIGPVFLAPATRMIGDLPRKACVWCGGPELQKKVGLARRLRSMVRGWPRVADFKCNHVLRLRARQVRIRSHQTASKEFTMSSVSNASLLTSIVTARDTRPPANPNAQRTAEFNAAAKSLGLTQEQTDALRKQVDDAIEAAKQGKAVPGARDTIKNAVDEVLKQNGIDAKKFHAALDKAHRGNSTGGNAAPKSFRQISAAPVLVQPAIVGTITSDSVDVVA